MRRVLIALSTVMVMSVFAFSSEAIATTYPPIVGEGSSVASAIVDDWHQAVFNQGLTVDYAATGDSAGLTGFANGSDNFAVTALPYGMSGVTPSAPGRAFGYAPVTASAVALMYNLSINGQQVQGLRLSAPTIAGIFDGTITNWDDPAITSDNGGNALPSLAITPVVRSDASGNTVALTNWLTAVAPTAWTCGTNLAFFTQCSVYSPGTQQAKPGDTGVAGFVGQAGSNGRIGYVDDTYALASGYPVAAVQNASGHYVLPTADNASRALSDSTVATGGLVDLSAAYSSPDPVTYPVMMPIYAVLPTDTSNITALQGQALVNFISYSACGGQQSAATLGMTPVTPNLVEDTFNVLHELSTANSAIDTSSADMAKCSANPTFAIRNLTPPTFSGTVRAGYVVTASAGSWTQSPTSYTYQWLENGYPIAGATGRSYVVARNLGGRYLSVEVAAHRSGFAGALSTSSDKLVPLVPFIEVTAPHLYGTLRVGSTVHVYLGGWNPGASSIGISWYVNGVRVSTGRSYLYLTSRMAGAKIRVVLRYARTGYVTRVVTLNALHVVWR